MGRQFSCLNTPTCGTYGAHAEGLTPAGELQVFGPKGRSVVALRSNPDAPEHDQDPTAAEKSSEITQELLKTFDSDEVYLLYPDS